jgi:5-methylcytosine-specific restriction endonuclease McrA
VFGFVRKFVDRITAAADGRSPKWPAVEHAFLKAHPACEACGTKTGLNVHHCVPFHVDAAKELDPENLLTLCRPHHLTFGHFMLWASWNKDVRQDVARYRTAFDNRPIPK